jgi:hypothetical protein
MGKIFVMHQMLRRTTTFLFFFWSNYNLGMAAVFFRICLIHLLQVDYFFKAYFTTTKLFDYCLVYWREWYR